MAPSVAFARPGSSSAEAASTRSGKDRDRGSQRGRPRWPRCGGSAHLCPFAFAAGCASNRLRSAPVAQLDRALAFEAKCRLFESDRACQVCRKRTFRQTALLPVESGRGLGIRGVARTSPFGWPDCSAHRLHEATQPAVPRIRIHAGMPHLRYGDGLRDDRPSRMRTRPQPPQESPAPPRPQCG